MTRVPPGEQMIALFTFRQFLDGKFVKEFRVIRAIRSAPTEPINDLPLPADVPAGQATRAIRNNRRECDVYRTRSTKRTTGVTAIGGWTVRMNDVRKRRSSGRSWFTHRYDWHCAWCPAVDHIGNQAPQTASLLSVTLRGSRITLRGAAAGNFR